MTEKIDEVIEAVLADYGKIHAGIKDILKREPETDGEMAMVNTAFIELNKRISRLPLREYLRSKQ